MNRAEVLDHGTRVCTAPGAGFGTDTNVITLITAAGARELPLMSKEAAAGEILDAALALAP